MVATDPKSMRASRSFIGGFLEGLRLNYAAWLAFQATSSQLLSPAPHHPICLIERRALISRIGPILQHVLKHDRDPGHSRAMFRGKVLFGRSVLCSRLAHFS